MIAAALVLDPALLIADEPTTALDVTTQAQILELIRELRERRGTGVLFITHDFGVVAEIAHRVVVMQHGRVVEQGTDRGRAAPAARRLHPHADPLGAEPQAAGARADHRRRRAADRRPHQDLRGGRLVRKRREVRGRRGRQPASVRRGETLGIVGESGSGKSTVARCIARLIEPTAGAILIGGADVAKLCAARAAPAPQARADRVPGPLPLAQSAPHRRRLDHRGADELRPAPRATRIERARQLMRLVGLDPDALDRYPHQFSGGQRQRICIARALAMEPELLIADEPVSALDVSVQAQVLELIDDVRQRFDLAVLFITHDLRVAAQVCDRIAVMQKGVVVEEGPTAEVFAAPKHEYTRALFEPRRGRISSSGSLRCRRTQHPRGASAEKDRVSKMRATQSATPRRRGGVRPRFAAGSGSSPCGRDYFPAILLYRNTKSSPKAAACGTRSRR